MPKLINKKAMKRYDFRIAEELINALYQLPISVDEETSEPKDISTLLHDVIDTIICSGATLEKDPFVSLTDITKAEAHYKSLPKNVQISFRENPNKIKFLQYYYRIKEYGYNNAKFTLPSPSAVIRTCIYDILENRISTELIKSSDTICPYDGQKNSKMNKWINSICTEIACANHLQSYCEPFMGSANTFLHLDDALVGITVENPSHKHPTKNPLEFSDFHLNDIDTFTYSLIKTIKSDLLTFIINVGKMPCTKIEFDYITSLIYPVSTDKNNQEHIDALTPMQKAVYLYYHHLLRYRNSKDTLESKNQYMIDETFEYDDFAFPISASFYTPAENETPGKKITQYTFEHNLTNYFTLLNHTRKLNAISNKLKKAYIYNLDFADFMEERLKTPNTLYYIDSPYFYSEDVYSENEFDHQKLSELVKRIQAPHNFFVMSNRLTVSAERKDDGLKNQDAIDMANKYYANCGYFYEIILYKRNKDFNACQVEILVSNFKFTGSTPYNHDITEEEVNDCIIQQKVKPNYSSK